MLAADCNSSPREAEMEGGNRCLRLSSDLHMQAGTLMQAHMYTATHITHTHTSLTHICTKTITKKTPLSFQLLFGAGSHPCAVQLEA